MPNGLLRHSASIFKGLSSSATPDVPTLGTPIVISDTQINIPVTSSYPYEMWYSTDNVTYTKHGDGATTPYEATGLTAGTLYYFKARGVNGSKLSEFTAAVSATTLFPELVTSLVNGTAHPYETVDISERNINSAINTVANGGINDNAMNLNVQIGDKFRLKFDCVINSGQSPTIAIFANREAIATKSSNSVIPTTGSYNTLLTIDVAGTNKAIVLYNVAAANWSITNLSLRKEL